MTFFERSVVPTRTNDGASGANDAGTEDVLVGVHSIGVHFGRNDSKDGDAGAEDALVEYDLAEDEPAEKDSNVDDLSGIDDAVGADDVRSLVGDEGAAGASLMMTGKPATSRPEGRKPARRQAT